MNDTKPATQSLTIISAGVTILALIVNQNGEILAEADQQELIESLSAIVAQVGAVLAIIGRMRATKEISDKEPRS